MVSGGIEGTGMLFLDSDVATCSNAKGWRPAPRSKHSVWRNGSIQVAGGPYPGYRWGRSPWNRADHPSQNRRTQEPRWQELEWLPKVEEEDFRMLNLVTTLPAPGKQWLDWARFILRFRSGDVEPHPGPRHRSASSRPPLPKAPGEGVLEKTRQERRMLLLT